MGEFGFCPEAVRGFWAEQWCDLSYTFKGALSARVDVGVHKEKQWCDAGGLDWSGSTGIGDMKFNSEYILKVDKRLRYVFTNREIRNDVKVFGLNSMFLHLLESVAASVSGNRRKTGEESKIWVALWKTSMVLGLVKTLSGLFWDHFVFLDPISPPQTHSFVKF